MISCCGQSWPLCTRQDTKEAALPSCRLSPSQQQLCARGRVVGRCPDLLLAECGAQKVQGCVGLGRILLREVTGWMMADEAQGPVNRAVKGLGPWM